LQAVQLAQLKHVLKTQAKVAIHDLGENREIITVERSADELDQTGQSTEREFAILGLSRRSELLRNIQGALARIDDGAFGTCANCEEPIGQNRLVAVPWTPFCIRCQETADRNGTTTSEPPYQLDVNAA
jgi:RNA polymerase-binding protein DksA